MEVYHVVKSYVCTDVAVWISNWPSDDNKHVEVFSIHMIFTLLWPVLVAHHLINPSLMVDNTFVRMHDKLCIYWSKK